MKIWVWILAFGWVLGSGVSSAQAGEPTSHELSSTRLNAFPPKWDDVKKIITKKNPSVTELQTQIDYFFEENSMHEGENPFNYGERIKLATWISNWNKEAEKSAPFFPKPEFKKLFDRILGSKSLDMAAIERIAEDIAPILHMQWVCLDENATVEMRGEKILKGDCTSTFSNADLNELSKASEFLAKQMAEVYQIKKESPVQKSTPPPATVSSSDGAEKTSKSQTTQANPPPQTSPVGGDTKKSVESSDSLTKNSTEPEKNRILAEKSVQPNLLRTENDQQVEAPVPNSADAAASTSKDGPESSQSDYEPASDALEALTPPNPLANGDTSLPEGRDFSQEDPNDLTNADDDAEARSAERRERRARENTAPAGGGGGGGGGGDSQPPIDPISQLAQLAGIASSFGGAMGGGQPRPPLNIQQPQLPQPQAIPAFQPPPPIPEVTLSEATARGLQFQGPTEDQLAARRESFNQYLKQMSETTNTMIQNLAQIGSRYMTMNGPSIAAAQQAMRPMLGSVGQRLFQNPSNNYPSIQGGGFPPNRLMPSLMRGPASAMGIPAASRLQGLQSFPAAQQQQQRGRGMVGPSGRAVSFGTETPNGRPYLPVKKRIFH